MNLLNFIKHTVFLVFTVLCLAIIIDSCGNGEQAKSSDNTNNREAMDADSGSASCEKEDETIKYPNETKPMALMMRTMVNNMQQMRDDLLQHKQLDSLKYPFIRFYLVEPTDKSVLEPAFFENARLFQQAYLDLFRHPAEQVKYYNLVVGKCINCHENYCSGPLKRIRKLSITQ
jgi:hypothetical protein